MLEQVISAYGLRDDATDEAPAPAAPPAARPQHPGRRPGRREMLRQPHFARGLSVSVLGLSGSGNILRSVWSIRLVDMKKIFHLSSFFSFYFVLFLPPSLSLSLSLFPSSFLSHTYKHKLKDKARLTKQRHKTNSK